MTRHACWCLAALLAVAAEPPAPDCGGTCKACVCVPDTKKVPHVTYDCKCEDFCKPRILPPCLRKFFGLSCDNCGKPIVIHKLVKFVENRDEPTTKCQVQVVPAACAPCAAPHH
jgi:hypothetical protein